MCCFTIAVVFYGTGGILTKRSSGTPTWIQCTGVSVFKIFEGSRQEGTPDGTENDSGYTGVMPH
ncbi:MAG: hypothetical protein M1469_10120 [Bacteroidetes bacterium]|nr:hypothetical protein [Bacteroidota bacterium]